MKVSEFGPVTGFDKASTLMSEFGPVTGFDKASTLIKHRL